MATPAWYFPPANNLSGVSQGSVETYDNALLISGLAREICQNSIDARLDPSKPVRVRFELRELETERFDVFKQLQDRVDRCRMFWSVSNRTADLRLTELLNSADKMLGRTRIPVLVASDFNTTGCAGSREGAFVKTPWSSLTSSVGVSDKAEGSGGSYGIGKNAPFAASACRTVFYNTYAQGDGERAFTGTAMLASMGRDDDPEKGTTSVGRYGVGSDDDELSPIFPDTPCALRDQFTRDDYGTDVIIAGFKGAESDWAVEIAKAVLENFFVAILDGNLVVDVDETHIASDTIEELEDTLLSGGDDSVLMQDAYRYYLTYTDPDGGAPVRAAIMEPDDLEVYFKTGDAMSKRSCNVNSHGMTIGKKTRKSSVRYNAVAVVRGKELGKLLSAAEDPEHRMWDAARAGNREAEVRRTIQKIDNLIRNHAKELVDTGGGEEIDADISDFLPAPGVTAESKNPGDDELKVVQRIRTTRPAATRTNSVAPASRGTGGPVPGEPHNSTVNPDPHPDEPPKPIVTGTGDTEGVRPQGGDKTAHTLRIKDQRIFPINAKAGLYQAVVLPDGAEDKAYLTLSANGDNGKSYPLSAMKCMVAGKPARIESGVIGPVHLDDGVNKLVITLTEHEPLRLNLTVKS